MSNSMKKIVLLLALAILPGAAFAQSTSVAARTSVGAEYKIVKGLHLKAEEELRIDDGFSSIASLRTTAGISYKPIDYVKIGAGYTLINPWKNSASAFNAPRHRAYGEVTGYLKFGDVQLSLKERLQYTKRTSVSNIYQTNPNELVLKSRLKAAYKGWRTVTPSLAFEIRTALNEPWGYTTGSAKTTKTSKRTYYDFTFSGYNHVYNNRYRGELAADIRLAKHHNLIPYVLLDYHNNYEIDTNGSDNWAKDGLRLFSAEYVNALRVSVCLAYEFHF